MGPDYLNVIEVESARFRQALASAPSAAPVPSCPGWDADDLLWHLTEVQEFWGTVVRDRLSDPEGMARIERPPDRDGLLAAFDEMSSLLVAALSSTEPDDRVWTWSDDQSVGFVLRRQAHEALIHRIDAELAARLPVTAAEPVLAADGVDELVELFIDVPDWGSFSPRDGVAQLVAIDTGQTWGVELGTFAGTSPTSGKTYEGLAAARQTEAEPDGVIRGTAFDLDSWLWGRHGEVVVTGSQDVALALRSLVAESTQ